MDVVPPVEGLAEDPPPGVRWGLADAVAWFLVAQIGSMLWSTVVLVAYGGRSALEDPTKTVPLLFAMQLGLWFGYGVGPLLTARMRGNGPRRDFGAYARTGDLWWVLGGVILQVVVLPIIYIPIQLLTDGDPSESSRRLIGMADNWVDVGLLTVMILIGAPLVEELFFRGLFLRALVFRVGAPGGVIISALVFALVHLQPLALPGLFVFGLVAAEITRRSGRLGPAWFLHLGFNAVTLGILLSSANN